MSALSRRGKCHAVQARSLIRPPPVCSAASCICRPSSSSTGSVKASKPTVPAAQLEPVTGLASSAKSPAAQPPRSSWRDLTPACERRTLPITGCCSRRSPARRETTGPPAAADAAGASEFIGFDAGGTWPGAPVFVGTGAVCRAPRFVAPGHYGRHVSGEQGIGVCVARALSRGRPLAR